MRHNLHNLIACCFLFALATVFCFKSLSLGIGSLRNPGAGFVPFWSATLLACLSLVIFVKSIGKNKVVLQFGKGWKKCAWVLGNLLFYFFFLEKLGFVITTFIVIFALLLTFQDKKWISTLLLTLLTVFLSYLIFDYWLGVKLPKGIFKI
jgi:putative tricarboxylic transport membrane protein